MAYQEHTYIYYIINYNHQKLLDSRARQLKFKVINKKHPTLLALPTQK